MYSCPTDDIHSVYIDDELPQNYVLDYENHEILRQAQDDSVCIRMTVI